MILALLGALMIGISLGLLGAGGSILTVPVLVFVLQRPEKEAIAESLAIVGCTALMGAIPYAFRHQIHWKSVLLFGLPGMLGAYVGGCISYYLSGQMQLTIFAFVMLIVAGMMLFGPPTFEKLNPSRSFAWLIMLEGFLIGCLTGCIGIGGGFLIVPALVILSQLPMTLAIGTSLMIIAINAFIGFGQQLLNLSHLQLHVDWQVIGIISIAGIFGSIVAGFIAQKIPQIYLRKTFGLSVLVMGIYMLIRQL
jgi:uncharacterized membrane protein YfcA